MKQLLPLLVAFFSAAAFGAEKPNIVFILADDLGYGDVHCLNPKRGKIPTPNLDRLNDLMATCAAILGEKLPENAGEDSFNILPLLEGGDRPVHEALVHHSTNGKFAIRQGRWKLMLCPGSGGWSAPTDQYAKTLGLPPVQLYDMEADFSETTNLQAKHPEVVE